ncbi:unnamed protein product [Ectocarpus sp. CCAP 1310/34]|nr:unnamed protein product [Ectocarpus sp. CCAP 1310/34]
MLVKVSWYVNRLMEWWMIGSAPEGFRGPINSLLHVPLKEVPPSPTFIEQPSRV